MPKITPNTLPPRISFRGPFKNKELRDYLIYQYQEGLPYLDIWKSLKSHWPEDKTKHASFNAVNRFFRNARLGLYKVYGIDLDYRPFIQIIQKAPPPPPPPPPPLPLFG